MEREQEGFSLIELLVVVMIVLVIAAVAIPNLLRSRMSANEASAVASMRTVMTAEIIYSTNYPAGFSVDLQSLADGGAPANCLPPAIPGAGSACLIDAPLGNGIKNGYAFTYAAAGGSGVNTTYTLHADPTVPGGTGQRHFYTDETHVMRVNSSAVASSTDPPM